MKLDNRNLFIIILIVLVTGLILYYLYMKPKYEPFEPTIPEGCPTLPATDIPVSCISRFFGIGFNIFPVPNQIDKFLIEHIPVNTTSTLGSMYAISADGQLTIQLRNDQDTTQWWSFISKNDDKSDYFIIMPFNMQDNDPKYALQYENGNLALRPYYENISFESQKWILSNNKITRGIPVLNYSPGSLFTPEFDPYSTTTNLNASTISQQNSQQVNDVVNAIKTNIQQYLKTIGATQQNVPQITQSSIGNKETPLNINVNFGNDKSNTPGGITVGGSSLSSFANIDGTTSTNDVLSLLDRYENPPSSQSDFLLMANKNPACSNINLTDYVSNRVGSCNCKL